MGGYRKQPSAIRNKGGIQSEWNGIIIQTSETQRSMGGTRCGYFFTTTTILWQYSNVGNLFIMSSGAEHSIRYRVASQRVPTRCYRDRSERVCWKLTFIQIIPARPL